MDELTKRFVTALGELHDSGDVESLVGLFGDDVTLSKAGVSHTQHGTEGARAFWQQYRDVFDTISSKFSRIVTDDDVAYLEWTSEGTLSGGAPISYDGVSVLEGDGAVVNAFRTYYDTAAFLPPDEHTPAAT